MPFTGALIICSLSLYMLALFAVAWRADRNVVTIAKPHLRAVIYALSITVYFTSWTYYGAVGTAARSGWEYLPIFLGPILAITLGYPLWRRVAVAAKRENVGSIADFLSSRYGKNRVLGTIVALVTIIGTMPYIALQLKSLSMTWIRVTGSSASSELAVPVIAAALAGFAILFGARRPTLTEHSRGLVRAIALESVVKLTAFMSVAALGLYSIYRSGIAITPANFGVLTFHPEMAPTFLASTALAFAAIFCLPRQFHMGFVELEKVEDLRTARWLVPLYLGITTLTVIPILIAGSLISSAPSNNPDLYVLDIPLRFGGSFLTALAYLGGFSAATAMVTVETVALSAMISNELVLPFLAHVRQTERSQNVGGLIVNIRRGAIITVIFLGWLYYRSMNQGEALGQIGLTSFAAIAQLLPSLVGAVFWKRGHARGAIWGICAGMAVWLFAIAAPQFVPRISPAALLGDVNPGPHSDGFFVASVFFSLALNSLLYAGISLRSRMRLIDRIQSEAFLRAEPRTAYIRSDRKLQGNVGDLRAMLSQFLGAQDAVRAFQGLKRERQGQLRDSDEIDSVLARAAERLLAGAIGASLARSVIGKQLSGEREQPAEVLKVLDEAASAVQFSRELLQITLDNVEQGVSVVDSELRLLAWNSKYIELFEFPDGFLYPGQPIAEVMAFSAAHSGLGGSGLGEYTERRLEPIRKRLPQNLERVLANGTIVKIQGMPIPGDRYINSYTDVTELHGAASALKNANEQLEKVNELLEARVYDRTKELTAANVALGEAKAVAERATRAQTRFLAAASHDVLQPLQAARLLLGTLAEDVLTDDGAAAELLASTDLCIESADRLLRALLNLSRLEVGGIKPEVRPVDAGALLEELQREFALVAMEKGLVLKAVPSQAWVLSDPDLLRSILQNLIGNAVRYTKRGCILLGCRFERNGIRLEVRDSGPGIPKDQVDVIFKEYFRLPSGIESGPGAGLGLSIVERICDLLGHRLTVRSEVGKGSVFSVSVPRAEGGIRAMTEGIPGIVPRGSRILYVENDAAVLQSMKGLLTKWDLEFSAAASLTEALALKGDWDVVLADYHLEADGNGLDILKALRGRAKVFALVTAAPTDEIIDDSAMLDIEVIRKPVSPIFLRAFLARSLRRKATEPA